MWLDTEIHEQVKEATGTYYTKDYINNKGKEVYIPKDNIISMIEDLLAEIKHKKEEYEHLERDLEDNYVSRPMSHYTGDPDDDRY